TLGPPSHGYSREATAGCCGFGAIILLLVLTKIGEPRALEELRRHLEGLVAQLQAELHEIRGETHVLNRELVSKQEQLSEERAQVARLRGDLSRIQGEFAATSQLSEVNEIVEGRLLAAQQELTEEMRRLQGRSDRRPADAPIGGIPVDSEYIIFIIDTSGSMHNYAWPLVQEKMKETLDIYPKVKGLQVMNDMGQHMFKNYAGKWIPDTPGRRRVILDRLRSWAPFSNSSPVEGITRAIRTYAAPDKRISLYVFGDEFTGSSIDDVVRRVERMNQEDAEGNRLVRIHGVGFPVMFSQASISENTGVRFATLMRILCRKNGGAFVGLSWSRS
nr:VWA domain-containing protein [Anaerolineales bacterium]